MSINLELPKKLRVTVDQAHQAAAEIFRPISRKYDLREHDYPVELDTLASLYDGLAETGQAGAGADGGRSDVRERRDRLSESRDLVLSSTSLTCPRGRVIVGSSSGVVIGPRHAPTGPGPGRGADR